MINKYSVVPDFKERNSFTPQNENERENKIRNSAWRDRESYSEPRLVYKSHDMLQIMNGASNFRTKKVFKGATKMMH